MAQGPWFDFWHCFERIRYQVMSKRFLAEALVILTMLRVWLVIRQCPVYCFIIHTSFIVKIHLLSARKSNNSRVDHNNGSEYTFYFQICSRMPISIIEQSWHFSRSGFKRNLSRTCNKALHYIIYLFCIPHLIFLLNFPNSSTGSWYSRYWVNSVLIWLFFIHLAFVSFFSNDI